MKFSLVLTILFISITVPSSPASASVVQKISQSRGLKFRVNPTGGRWESGVYEWYYNPQLQPKWTNTQRVVDLIQYTMTNWSNESGIKFQYMGISSDPTVMNGINTIGWTSAQSSDGLTYWYFDAGRMTEADISLNATPINSDSQIYQIVLHEVGHAIGLDHSDVENNVMSGPPLTTYTWPTVLQSDDIAGARALYGDSQNSHPELFCGPPVSPEIRIDSCPEGSHGQIIREGHHKCENGFWQVTRWRVVESACSPNQPDNSTDADAVAVEYYHSDLGTYFMTSLENEKKLLNEGAFDGKWKPTGVTYKVWGHPTRYTNPMCRFYGYQSHFYTLNPYECDIVPKKWPEWLFEGQVFHAIPTSSSGTCPAATTPVYRYFRPTGSPNHRYVTTPAQRREMDSRGWIAEGITWCAGT